MHSRRRPTPLWAACLALSCGLIASSPARAAAAAPTQPAPPAADVQIAKQVQGTVNRLIGAIRFQKDDLAAQQLALTAMGQALMADSWTRMTPAQQAAFAADLETILRGISFPRGREMFVHFKAILLGPVQIDGAQARVRSTITVHEALKKTEIPLEWVLVRSDSAWRVVDVMTLGESTMAGLRQDQVLPLLQEGGIEKVLAALHAKASEFKGHK